MSFLDGAGLADVWAAVKNYVDNKIIAGVPDGGITTAKLANNAVTSAKLSNDVVNRINPVSFTNLDDFKAKIYGGSSAVMQSVTPYMFVGQSSWSTAVLGTGKTGRSWGICFCYTATSVHALFMYGGDLYKMTYAVSGQTEIITVKSIPAATWT